MPFFLTVLFSICSAVHAINVALHAQVKPSANQIVGSVITTDGLKAALERRPDVDSVKVFYPASYHEYLDTEWDLLLIEGWFPSIVEFIQLTRNRFHNIKVVYYCLDPTYPPYDELITFDFDGILTNSKDLLSKLPLSNKELMLLAADEVHMAPNASIAKEYGAVYVGAGGPMLQQKPALYNALLSAVPHKLRLHGFHWDTVEGLNTVWQGALPRNELASAYASAHTVLASTIASQGDNGMINNRIFEALSCGAVIISDHSQALADLLTHRKDRISGYPLPDLILFFNESNPADKLIDRVVRNPRYYNEMRRMAREFIIQGHTWSHRAVQLMHFYDRLLSADSASAVASPDVLSRSSSENRLCPEANRCKRYRCPRLLWLVSESLSHHSDYLHHLSVFQSSYACRMYDIVTISEKEWMTRIQQWNEGTCTVDPNTDGSDCTAEGYLSQFDVLLVHAVPYDSLDVSMSYLPSSIQVKGKQRLQKRALMMMGFDTVLLLRMSQEALQLDSVEVSDLRAVFSSHFVNHYDAVMFRSYFELNLLRDMVGCQFDSMRIQHVFGVGMSGSPDGSHVAKFKKPHDVVVCFYTQRHLCSSVLRENQLLPVSRSQDRTVLLLLLGGDWEGWLQIVEIILPGEVQNVIHVKEREYSQRAVAVVRTAGHVYLMQEKNEITRIFDSDTFWNQCVTAPTEACLLNTTSDVLWPFVAAASSEHNVSIHLLRTVTGLFDLVDRDVGVWTEQMASESIYWALNRVHGFASRLSRVSAQVLSIDAKSATITCTNCDPSDVPVVDLIQSGYLDQWRQRMVADGVSPRVVQKLLVRMKYDEFVVGRDGECCLEQIVSEARDNVVCLQRSFDFVELVIVANSSVNLAELRAIPLRVYLRGTFYADPFYSVSVDVPVEVLDTSLLIGKHHLTVSDTSGPLKNKIFPYTLYV